MANSEKIFIKFSGESPEYLMKQSKGGCSVREERAKLRLKK